MKNIGCHVSNKGYVSMYKDTIYVGGNTFQFFTRNPRGGSSKEIDLEDIDKFNQLKKEANFAPLIAVLGNGGGGSSSNSLKYHKAFFNQSWAPRAETYDWDDDERIYTISDLNSSINLPPAW